MSVVIPCFNAAPIALESVDRLRAYFVAARIPTWEIIVVDDGGGDFPNSAWSDIQNIHLIRLERNRGKGAAIREGVRHASGRALIVTDVDLPYGSSPIGPMVDDLIYGPFHVVFGDRTIFGSEYASSSMIRRWLSGIATTFIGTLVTGGFFDTQCGLKGFRGDVANLLFPLVSIDGFAFDVEVVYLALRYNLTIRRIPVVLERAAGPTTVRPVRDSLRAAADILWIKRRAWAGNYQCDELQTLTFREYVARRDRDRLPIDAAQESHRLDRPCR